MKDSLGDRMKSAYEDRFRFELPRRMPCIIRLDGKAFHTYTKSFNRPFDRRLADSMNYAAEQLATEIQGFKLAFLQSDECSILVTDYDQIETEAWFDYNKAKMETISASIFTAHFNQKVKELTPDKVGMIGYELAFFDARAFPMPREDVANYFLWRAKDWERNSLSMYCRSFFSAKQLHGKNRQDQHDMLHAQGKNWTTDLASIWRNGTWIVRDDSDLIWHNKDWIKKDGNGLIVRHDIQPLYQQIAAIVNPLVTERAEDSD